MPSSSARFTQLPRAEDKVRFYLALKKLRDYLNGLIPEPAASEVTFPEENFRIIPRSERPGYTGPPTPRVKKERVKSEPKTGSKRASKRSDSALMAIDDNSMSQSSTADDPAQVQTEVRDFLSISALSPLPSLPALNGGSSQSQGSSSEPKVSELPDIMSAFSPSAMQVALTQSGSMQSSGYASIPESPTTPLPSNASATGAQPLKREPSPLQELSGDSLFDLLDLPEIDANASVHAPLTDVLFDAEEPLNDSLIDSSLKLVTSALEPCPHPMTPQRPPTATLEHFNNCHFQQHTPTNPPQHFNSGLAHAQTHSPMMTSTPIRARQPAAYMQPYDTISSPISPYFSPQVRGFAPRFAPRHAPPPYSGHVQQFGFASPRPDGGTGLSQQPNSFHGFPRAGAGAVAPQGFRHPYWNSF